MEPLSRRDFLAAGAGTAVAAVIPTQSAHPRIEVNHRHWKRTPVPLGHLSDSEKAYYYRWVSWYRERERRRVMLYDTAIGRPITTDTLVAHTGLSLVDLKDMTPFERGLIGRVNPPINTDGVHPIAGCGLLPREMEELVLEGELSEACAERVQRAALYKYFYFSWSYTNPFRGWPDWWAEQSERLQWLHDKFDRPFPWATRRKLWQGTPIDLEVLRQVNPALLGQIITMSSSRGGRGGSGGGGAGGGGGAPEMVMSGDYAVDVDNLSGIASDSNDGVWDGDGPWLTWGKFASEFVAGTFDNATCWMRGGTYAPTAAITISGDGWIVGHWPGDADAIIDYTSNPEGAIDYASGDGPITMDGTGTVKTWDQIHIENEQNGWTAAVNSRNIEWYGTQKTWTGTTDGNSEHAATHRFREGSGALLVEGHEVHSAKPPQVSSPASANLSPELWYITLATLNPTMIVRGCYYEKETDMAGGGECIYHKRQSNLFSIQGQVQFANNMLSYKTAGGGYSGAYLALGSAYHDHTNEIMTVPQYGVCYRDWDPGSGQEPGNSNRFLHVTAGQTGTLANNGAILDIRQQYNTSPGGEDNVVRDTVCTGQIQLARNTGYADYDHNTDIDYIHYRGSGNFAREKDTQYSNPATWEANTTNFAGGAHDANSVYETPNFAGTPDQDDPTTWALAMASAGAGAAEDMTDMGADTSMVGPAAYGY